NEGYQNITRIVSLGFTEGRADAANHGVPVVERRHVLEHAAGVIVLFTEKSDVGQALVSSMPEKADELLTEWQAQFDDRLYFAIKRTNRSGEDAFIKAAIHAGAKHRIPIIAHNDVRFLEQDDFDAHEARVCIAGSYVLADPNRPRSEEHTSELQSRFDLVCRLLLEKKNMMAYFIGTARVCAAAAFIIIGLGPAAVVNVR